MPLEILHQDPWLVAVNKPAGMLVHAGREPEPSSEIAMKVLRDQLGRRIYTVHRLDRPTSGVLLFALDRVVEAELRRQFEAHEVEKQYAAVVLGAARPAWTSSTPLRKSEEDPLQEARTRFVCDGRGRIGSHFFSQVSAFPVTGRHHQIRKHLSSGGLPIVGDYLYGNIDVMNQVAEASGQTRLMLHASRLCFRHPVTEIRMAVECPLPDRFAPFADVAAAGPPPGEAPEGTSRERRDGRR